MKRYFLISILLLASALRLVGLSQYPSGLNADEAALGYNAYSLMTTGRDEHGHFLPINLESFGDFKPALYAYMLIPFIKVLGLTELAVRLPSALFGILAVYFIYLLCKELYLSPNPSPTQRAKSPDLVIGEGNGRGEVLGLISALILAISPWHLHFSRGAWEVNVATTLLLIGVWFFLKWSKSHKSSFLVLSALHFVLSMYTYQSTRIIAPLLGLGLVALSFRDLISKSKQIFLSFLTLLILLTPLILSIVTSDAASRFSGVGFIADEGPLNRIKEFRGQYANPSNLFARAMHNKITIYGIQFLKNYFAHFDGNFLFVNGDIIQRNRIPETGLLYLFDFVFIALGLVYLIRNTRYKIQVILLWLLIAPIASALTFQVPHALRAQNMVIPLTILLSAGIYWITKKWKLIGICSLCIVYLWLSARYLHQYYVHYPKTYPPAWEYGFKELVSYTEGIKDQYDKVFVTDKYDQPYILFLFYSKYSPQIFQADHELTFRDKFNFSTVRDYDKYHFESTPWDKVRDIHATLIVAAPEDIPEVGVNIVKTIYFPNGDPAFKIVSN